MPAIQSTYLQNIPAYKVGHRPDMTAADVISRTVETAAGIGMGVPVAQGADPKGVIAYAGSGFLGVTCRDRSIRLTATDTFAQYDSAPILKKGPICVLASEAVVAGDPVYLTPAGLFVKTATSNVQIANARWDTTTASGAIGVIFIK